MQMHHASIPSDVLPSSLYLFYYYFQFRGFAFKCRASFGRCKKRGCNFFVEKITVFGVFYSELVDRAASHAACMAFESLWSTSPFTLPARLWKFCFRLSWFRHEWTIKSALCEPESSCHFRDFRFVLSIPFGGRVPSTMWDLCGKPSHLGGQVWAAPPLRLFKILNS